ncbi:phosphatase PAP2 family protein [Candidatus Poribacteria bacterium]|nr:phosphatase PAP2 family protein [Candidatus Poribacteria bacterium]MBT5536866.1 phosphatase PAP2 family protein [Candidatus Poribacteria bacterium]MBT5709476.1 phosphatase PAP2 family protein [Candidatus Poribacteria bacterium]MBT7097731.1 phosphatase PAP2 family protein [Candidatus Poribacteria bacterium]MBT7808351.1 phosphatase PAP2 family protein [Candidatus Poribacteria bacterium]
MPVVLFGPLYGATGRITAGLPWRVLHGPVEAADLALFGGQPSMYLAERFSWLALSEALHLAYFSYYLLLMAAPIHLLASRRDAEARYAVLAGSATMFVCMAFYIWLPVSSPYYLYPPLSPPLSDGVFYRLVHAVSGRGGVDGAAFPSSHVALSGVSAAFAWRSSRRLGLAVVVPALGIVFATVYCRFHFAVDSIAGLALAVAACGVYRPLDMRRDARPTA